MASVLYISSSDGLGPAKARLDPPIRIFLSVQSAAGTSVSVADGKTLRQAFASSLKQCLQCAWAVCKGKHLQSIQQALKHNVEVLKTSSAPVWEY